MINGLKLKSIIFILIAFQFLPGRAQVPSTADQHQAFSDYIHVYQKYISPIRGSHCQMYPSCSNFGLGVLICILFLLVKGGEADIPAGTQIHAAIAGTTFINV